MINFNTFINKEFYKFMLINNNSLTTFIKDYLLFIFLL